MYFFYNCIKLLSYLFFINGPSPSPVGTIYSRSLACLADGRGARTLFYTLTMPLSSRTRGFVAGLVFLCLVAGIPSGGSKRRSAKDWNKIATHRLGDVDQQWRDGDDEAELITEDQEEYNRMEARKNAPAQVPTNFESVDPNEWMKHQQAVVGPTMVFAKLNHTMKNGKKLKKADTEDFAFMWKELLFLGGVNVTSYAIEFDTVLMTLQRGWNGYELKDYLLTKEEVIQVEWDNIKYIPDRLKSKEQLASEKKMKEMNRKRQRSQRKRDKKTKGKKRKGKKKKSKKSKGKKKRRKATSKPREEL